MAGSATYTYHYGSGSGAQTAHVGPDASAYIANISASAYFPGEQDDTDFFAWRRAHPVTIGHDVWIGHGAVILPGRSIGTGAVVGAGAIVTKDVRPYAIVVGNPAEPVRPRFPEIGRAHV